MLKDTKIKNGEYTKVVRVQYALAKRAGVSSLGSKYKKGSRIYHFSSTRCTGEVFVLTSPDMYYVSRDWSTTGEISNVNAGRMSKKLLKEETSQR